MPDRAISRTRWLLVFWLFVLSAVAFLDRVNISIAGASIATEFGLSNVHLGWVFSSFLLGYALFQTPGGWLSDRLGPRRVLTAGVIWWGIFTALTAAEIAQSAEFFSFGTNDLTQTTMGLSRDDAGRFLPSYIDRGIFADDPFQVLDTEGVGRLVRIAVTEGRRVRPDIKLGICGEHGGEPRSIAFCHSLGLDYVSCSPFRVPIARLAAAHAALEA